MMTRILDRHLPTLSELLRGMVAPTPERDRGVSRLSLDSRDVTRGTLYCALAGTRNHGMAFAAAAAQKGAVAVLAEPAGEWTPGRIAAAEAELGIPVLVLPELSHRLGAIASRFHGDPARQLDLIGVTGTNGKSSVCQFVAQALDGDRYCGLVGTLGHGFPGDLSPATHTTPDAIRLHEILAGLRARGAQAAAMEVSSHALVQGRVAGLTMDTAIFTNLTRDHLDYHGDMEGYAQAKRRLFHLAGLRHAVLNADDPFGWDILHSLARPVRPLLYGLGGDWHAPAGVSWLRVAEAVTQPRGMTLRVEGSWGTGSLTTPLLGRFNAANLTAVLGVLLLRGWDLEGALARLEQVRGVPGRMERFGRTGQPLVVVDYAHTPDALEKALSALREHGPRRLICLFGCGGERDRGKRPLMGAVAEHFADRVIVTDDNPRGEDGAQIVQDILAGMQEPQRAKIERNRGRAIRYAVCLAGPGDILLVAGKGHEATQKSGDLELPFSDRAQVTQVLNEWGDCVQ